jgi:hypothetical protein
MVATVAIDGERAHAILAHVAEAHRWATVALERLTAGKVLAWLAVNRDHDNRSPGASSQIGRNQTARAVTAIGGAGSAGNRCGDQLAQFLGHWPIGLLAY